jgi:lysophospholipase L1-like esterase
MYWHGRAQHRWSSRGRHFLFAAIGFALLGAGALPVSAATQREPSLTEAAVPLFGDRNFGADFKWAGPESVAVSDAGWVAYNALDPVSNSSLLRTVSVDTLSSSTLVSYPNDEGSSSIQSVDISSDGNHVAFFARYDQLVPGLSSKGYGPFLAHRASSGIEALVQTTDGKVPYSAGQASVSDDGTTTVFTGAVNMIGGGAGAGCYRKTGTSVPTMVLPGGGSWTSSISGDGRYITCVVPSNNWRKTRLDTQTGIEVTLPNNTISVSHDGRFVLYSEQTTSVWATFVRDIDSGNSVEVQALHGVPYGVDTIEGWVADGGQRVAIGFNRLGSSAGTDTFSYQKVVSLPSQTELWSHTEQGSANATWFWASPKIEIVVQLSLASGTGLLATRLPPRSDEQPRCPDGSLRKRGDTNCDGVVRVAIIGDSYISGEGAATGIESEPPLEDPAIYEQDTDDVSVLDIGPSNACHRSPASWAVRQAKSLGVAPTDLLFVACSGAVIDNVVTNGQYPFSPTGVFGSSSQIDELRTFNTSRAVDLVFVSIGGNDIGFSDIITECIVFACRYHTAWLNRWQQDIQLVGENLVRTLGLISVAAPHAQVWAADYPDPLMKKTCLATELIGVGPIDKPEQDWLKQNVISYLDGQIRAAAQRAHVKFFDIKDAFAGHQICSDTKEWYANGLTAGNDIPIRRVGPLAAESFHPTAAGHRALATEAANAFFADPAFGLTASFVGPPPPPPVGVGMPKLTAFASQSSQSPTSKLQPAQSFYLTASGVTPATQFLAMMNSVPTILGRVLSTSTGEISVETRVPAATAPGYHRLSLIDPTTGESLVGTAILVGDTPACRSSAVLADGDADSLPDFCDPFLADGPQGDFDGDGVANRLDDCPTVSDPYQLDANDNGRGDACDATLGRDPTAAYLALSRTAGDFRAVVPGRLLDSRQPASPTVDGLFEGIGPRLKGSITELQVTGRAGVPTDASAVVLNVTVTAAQGDGFVTVWPCGTDLPNASSLNFTTGQTVPNAVIAKIGAGGKVCLYTSAATHLLADINGIYPTAS